LPDSAEGEWGAENARTENARTQNDGRDTAEK